MYNVLPISCLPCLKPETSPIFPKITENIVEKSATLSKSAFCFSSTDSEFDTGSKGKKTSPVLIGPPLLETSTPFQYPIHLRKWQK